MPYIGAHKATKETPTPVCETRSVPFEPYRKTTTKKGQPGSRAPDDPQEEEKSLDLLQDEEETNSSSYQATWPTEKGDSTTWVENLYDPLLSQKKEGRGATYFCS